MGSVRSVSILVVRIVSFVFCFVMGYLGVPGKKVNESERRGANSVELQRRANDIKDVIPFCNVFFYLLF